MNIDSMTIGEARAIASLFQAQQAQCAIEDLGLRIVIADRGHVWVGRVTRAANTYTVSNAACVRRWGTKAGLGELAAKGPLSETMLDECGSVEIERRAVIATIPCEGAKWKR